jgi:membrane protease subunit HflC
MKIKSIIIVILIVIAFVVYNAAYTGDETEQVVVHQFAKSVGDPVTAPGLQFQVPFIPKATRFPGRQSQAESVRRGYSSSDSSSPSRSFI